VLKRDKAWRQAQRIAPPRGTTLPAYAEDMSLLVRLPRRLRVPGLHRTARVLS